MRRQVAATVGSGGASAARTAALRGEERRRGPGVVGRDRCRRQHRRRERRATGLKWSRSRRARRASVGPERNLLARNGRCSAYELRSHGTTNLPRSGPEVAGQSEQVAVYYREGSSRDTPRRRSPCQEAKRTRARAQRRAGVRRAGCELGYMEGAHRTRRADRAHREKEADRRVRATALARRSRRACPMSERSVGPLKAAAPNDTLGGLKNWQAGEERGHRDFRR
jgi:hypothetical protein